MIGTLRTIFGLGFAMLATLVLGPTQWVCMKSGLYRGPRVLHAWHSSILKAFGIRVRVFGGKAAGRPLMIAANHVSWTDIPVLGSVADVAFIAKAEVNRWPIVGWLSRLQRTVFIERERRGQSGAQASEIAGRLAGGDVMVLFAEGTTGDGNLVIPFKSTLFGAAARMLAAGGQDEVWIQPVAIAYTRLQGLPMGRQHRALASWIGDQDLGPHAVGLVRERAVDVEVHFGEAVKFTGKDDRKATARLIEARVRYLLQHALAHPGP